VTGWTSAEMAQVAELVRQSTGLVFPDARVADVEATIRKAMARHGVDQPAALVPLLRNDAAAREALVAELTIGETYFQRDPAQFRLLRQEVLPDLLQRRPVKRPVRVWSAGCASGEEPYSVAMLFEELGEAERCNIVGTDIARSRLQDAQRGIYSRWSLRNTPDPVRQRYFRERGRFYELAPRIREQVDFRYLNLAEDRFPSLSIGIWGMDVILCRNVLIYFDGETVQQVARRLIASLSEDGWLILGASDPAISEMVECDVVITDAGIVYRRPGAATGAGTGGPTWSAQRSAGRRQAEPVPEQEAEQEPQPEPESEPEDLAAVAALLADLAASLSPPDDDASPVEPARTGAPEAVARIEAAYDRRDFEAVTRLAAETPPAALTVEAWVAWIRALANQGCLEEAGDVTASALDAFGSSSAELLYLHGVLLLQAGRAGDAALALRQALYLDRTLVVAHLALADAQQRTGVQDGALRSLRNAAALLETLPQASHVAGADGETAGRLRELVRVKLRLLTVA
jgi:chemotaxis protein methyltransferase CheR